MTQQITADLVANVWKVLVSEGTVVAAGDTLAILESMKMEIPVHADGAGTVTRLAVAEGDVLDEGDLIAEID
ncbi:biotin/lipoyl-binding carrier protein [Streptomyces sp. NPDC127068]|uniref:biotin/lipoyl-binding carrier protein n=1 Tax=Streptomyces sp. NPDC127068 TaxID=3347127 RepID=UPI00366150EA